ncbi:RDD family protein [Flavobacteriaceae bacterium M23B6Z8]
MNETIEPGPFEDNAEFANVGYRILAFLIDFSIFWLIAMVFGIFFGEPPEDGIGFHFSGLPALGMFFIAFGLWPISEAISGQTIGKRIFNIKVVNTNYKPIGIGQAFGRFFLGIVDYMFLIGIIIALINKKNQRIGDMGANTIVVNAKKAYI